MRINKYLASTGIASRRKSEELITNGKVKVNGEVLKTLGYDVKVNVDTVTVNGRLVKLVQNNVYYKLHKPKGYVTSVSDDKGRKTVIDLMRGIQKRLFPIGRLDYDTEGLLILTDDGDLANKITHPKNKIDKKYVAKISGVLTKSDITLLENGVNIGDYTTGPAKIVVLDSDGKTNRVELTISEGKNRQIKRMFEAVGKQVVFLKRTEIGEIRLGGLSRGEYKQLNEKEMKIIQKLKAE